MERWNTLPRESSTGSKELAIPETASLGLAALVGSSEFSGARGSEQFGAAWTASELLVRRLGAQKMGSIKLPGFFRKLDTPKSTGAARNASEQLGVVRSCSV